MQQRFLLLAQNVSGTTMPTLQDAAKQHPANRTHNPQLHTRQQLENHSTKYQRQQPLYNTLELLMMGVVVPETC